jgi:hypothetical protein
LQSKFVNPHQLEDYNQDQTSVLSGCSQLCTLCAPNRFPSLVNCTTIDWFSEWPADALKSVAARFLCDVEMEDDRTRGAVEDMCMTFHQSIRTLAEDFKRCGSAVFWQTA